MVLVSALLPSVQSVLCMLKLIPPLGVVLGSARMDFQKWFHRGVAPALSVCVTLLFNTLRRLYIHTCMYSNTGSIRIAVRVDLKLLVHRGQCKVKLKKRAQPHIQTGALDASIAGQLARFRSMLLYCSLTEPAPWLAAAREAATTYE